MKIRDYKFRENKIDEVTGMKIWSRKIVVFILLIMSMIAGLMQGSVLRVKARTDTNSKISVTARVGSKKVNKKTYTMKQGNTKKINLSITPITLSIKKNYHSSKKSIVSVTRKGTLKAKKKGTAKITITVTSKKKQKKKIWFKVKVVKQSNPRKDEIPVTLIIGNKTFKAKFYDNQTAREFVEKMPITLSMKELNGNEKYYYFNTDFSVNETSPKQIHAGDIKLYGSDCLVAFYKTFTTSYQYTSIGYVKDTDGFVKAVGKGKVKIKFQKG